MKKYVVVYESNASFETKEEAVEEAKRNLNRYSARLKMYIYESAFCVEKGAVPFLVEDLTAKDEDFIGIVAGDIGEGEFIELTGADDDGRKISEVTAESPLSSSLNGTVATADAPAVPDGEKTLVDLPSDLQQATVSVDLAVQPQPDVPAKAPYTPYTPAPYYGYGW